MSEYTLKKDITTFQYPSHMKRPDGFFGSNFFEKWIPDWRRHLGHFKDQPNVVGVEIGCLHGDCAVFCANELVNGEGSVHYCIDINETEYLKNNISPYNNIKFLKGFSYDVIPSQLWKKQFADYILVDGSHIITDILQDAVLSWYILKDNGLLIFDDYNWGIHEPDALKRPKHVIDAFMTIYKDRFELIQLGWQVFLKKIPYQYTKEELEANYQ